MDNVLWYATRGSAIVSQVMFTVVVILGILTATRWHRPSWPAFLTVDVHRTLALTSLIFLAIHIVTAVIDPFTSLGWAAVLIPFSASYRQAFLGLGAVAMYLLVALIATSLLRDRIGLRTWRLIHWTAYAFWPVAILHGIGTGSDSAAAWMQAINGVCIAAVGGAVIWRVAEAVRRPAMAAAVPARIDTDRSGMLNPSGRPGGPHVEAGTYVTAPAAVGRPPDAAGSGRSVPSSFRVPGPLPGPDRLLAGPVASAGAERLADHRARLGPLPRSGAAIIPILEATGLQGRGGAGFPVGRKWRTVAERKSGGAVIVANGAEGKPTSRKDRVLMSLRPHLVLDGALLAADAVGAEEIVMLVGEEHRPALDAMQLAINERAAEFRLPVRLVEAPLSYVVGESSAAVHWINAGDPRPTATPPRMYERGVRGLPTVVQNVESLAYAALIARFGPDWYRSAGRGETPGTALVTVSGTTPAQRVIEIEFGTTLGEVLARVGGLTAAGSGVMLGDSFGAWADVHDARDLPMDPAVMRRHGLSFGAGVISVIPATTCGVIQTADVMAFMAGESAGQCGPCVYGMRALADATRRVANRVAAADDLDRIARWGAQLAGRGGCAHPDGAVTFLKSGLQVFADEFALHARGRCSVVGVGAVGSAGASVGLAGA